METPSTSPASTLANPRVNESSSAAACSTKTGNRAEYPRRNLASQRSRPLSSLNDQHDAPLDPNFTGCGHTLTDSEGRYRFVTIHPGEYPWRNHFNAWRPAHIHFSIFGPAFATRLVTQMYFPGDPLLPFDPIFNSVADEPARNRLISLFDWASTIPEQALGYTFDIILSGRDATPMERPTGTPHRNP